MKAAALFRTLARKRLAGTAPEASLQLEQAVEELVQKGQYREAQQLLLAHKQQYCVAHLAPETSQRIDEILDRIVVMLLS